MSLDEATRWRLRGRVDGRELSWNPSRGSFRVGSSPRSDFRLPGTGVSREHALLNVTSQGLAVVDCGSKNGTFVNGRRVQRAALEAGSVVTFGPVEMIVETLDEDDFELAISFEATGPDSWDALASMSQETAAWDPAARRFELTFPDTHLPGTSPAMTALYRRMEVAARGDQTVLIVGETGVGKEGLVSILHGSSQRRRGPLVTLNCAAIPTDLIEAELFGIAKGVATGVDARPGKVRQANGGTLFLDEIGDMPLPLQAKLLRVLQEKEIQPLGGRVERVDIRVAAATNAELERRVEDGDFRRDLYYRLAGIVLEPPPLRRRRTDIPALVEYFLRRFSAESRIRVRGVTVKAMSRWLAYDWPGNIRQLEHEVRQAVSQCADRGVIDLHKVSPAIVSAPIAPAAVVPDPAVPDPEKVRDQNESESSDLNLERRLQALETELIQEALRRTQGRQIHAAELLGVSRNGLARRLERLGIDYREYR